MPVIKVENLSKKYTLSHQRQERYTALQDVITDKFKALGSKLSFRNRV
jgi:lipopolysaccharide transport system ATP-binding protein